MYVRVSYMLTCTYMYSCIEYCFNTHKQFFVHRSVPVQYMICVVCVTQYLVTCWAVSFSRLLWPNFYIEACAS